MVGTGASATCTSCGANANACTSATVASGCVANYVVYSGACVPCLPGTTACNAPSSNSCSSGFVVVSGVCTACASGTAACAAGCTSATP